MDAQLKAKWVEALRSGEYKQTTDQLKSDDDCYCCLGVLCVVADISTDIGAGDVAYNWLTSKIGDWSPLVEMNDQLGKTFAEIAAHIEASL